MLMRVELQRICSDCEWEYRQRNSEVKCEDNLTDQRHPSPLLHCAGCSAGPGAAVSAAGAAAA